MRLVCVCLLACWPRAVVGVHPCLVFFRAAFVVAAANPTSPHLIAHLAKRHQPHPSVTPNKKELGLAFKREAKPVADALEALGEEDALCLKVDAPVAVAVVVLGCVFVCVNVR
jgi:hypothetical protein